MQNLTHANMLHHTHTRSGGQWSMKMNLGVNFDWLFHAQFHKAHITISSAEWGIDKGIHTHTIISCFHMPSRILGLHVCQQYTATFRADWLADTDTDVFISKWSYSCSGLLNGIQYCQPYTVNTGCEYY